MAAAGFRLGVDFGTSNTVAVLQWPDGRIRPLLFDGSPLLPSAVYVDDGGRFSVGRDALDSARMRPSRLEPNPKRCIDDGVVLLGDREVATTDLIAAVLHVVAEESRRTAGQRPSVVTLTCPAAWGNPRRRILLAAAAQAGLGEVRQVEEPVAAATYFAHVLGQGMAVGAAVVVYDFGGGTFDVSLVERTASGFRILAVAGRSDIGGLDLDEALVRRIGETYGPSNPVAWSRLVTPETRQERRLGRLFRDDVRAAKERLSRHPTADIHIPGLDRDAHVTREEFEQLAQPYINETVRLTAEITLSGGLPRDRIAGVFLVGGASRIPLVATMVHNGLGIAPTAIEQPEMVVGEGSLVVQSVVAMSDAAAPVATPDTPTAIVTQLPVSPVRGAARGRAATPVTTPFPPAPHRMPRATSPASGTDDRPATPTGPPPTPTGPPPVSTRPPPVSTRPPPVSTRPPPVPTEPPPSPGPERPRRAKRWIVAGALLIVLVVAVISVVTLWPDNGERETLPAACLLASRAPDRQALPPGNEAPATLDLPDAWTWHVDGYRIPYPKTWRTFGDGACFGDQSARRYMGVVQWEQSDRDLVRYWTDMESANRGRFAGYNKIDIGPRANYYDGAADWEFTFNEGGQQMHALGIALLSQPRGYGIFWVSKDLDWQSNLPQFFSTVYVGFKPAI